MSSKRTKVLLVCLGDDEAELRRRARAAGIHHRVVESDLDGSLYYWTPQELRLFEIDERQQVAPGGLGDALRWIMAQEPDGD